LKPLFFSFSSRETLHLYEYPNNYLQLSIHDSGKETTDIVHT